MDAFSPEPPGKITARRASIATPLALRPARFRLVSASALEFGNSDSTERGTSPSGAINGGSGVEGSGCKGAVVVGGRGRNAMLGGAAAGGCPIVGASSGSVGGGAILAPAGRGGQVNMSVATGGNVKVTAAAPLTKMGGLSPSGGNVGDATESGASSIGGVRPGGVTDSGDGAPAASGNDGGVTPPGAGGGGIGDSASDGATPDQLGDVTLVGSIPVGESLTHSLQLKMQFCLMRAELAPVHIPAAASSKQDVRESAHAGEMAVGETKLACCDVESRERGGNAGGDPTGGNAS